MANEYRVQHLAPSTPSALPKSLSSKQGQIVSTWCWMGTPQSVKAVNHALRWIQQMHSSLQEFLTL